MAHTWQLQEAKSRLSEVIVEAEKTGPQTITRRGVETAIVLSYKDYKKLLGNRGKLSQYFRDSPLVDEELDFSRSAGPIREIDIS